ncbi:hypothetical protein [Litoreibacter roseus]|uniref:Uncharacterized protein n=1 Tax=Litoreibacter roseus TaxID=2601869 RepID=A0A6N6JC05_9RHOB|nr:hypothetical protein [Litoreibacter roseus]GFE63604.1 hypothetical protein KIN_06780 [Litoreibacter roseus]
MTETVLILGSGPDVVTCRDWDRTPFDHIIAINNAWAVRPDWDSLIYPEDFPEDRRPAPRRGQRHVTALDYVPAQNSYGGFVYAGGTMAFTAGYWALHHFRPNVIAYLGCDMVYNRKGGTHFYGTGAADPLRADISLQSLEAKSARLKVMAAEQGCAMINLSGQKSRLVFPRSTPEDLRRAKAECWSGSAADAARAAERDLGYMVLSGRYWEVQDQFDAAALRRIDDLWMNAASASKEIAEAHA